MTQTTSQTQKVANSYALLNGDFNGYVGEVEEKNGKSGLDKFIKWRGRKLVTCL